MKALAICILPLALAGSLHAGTSHRTVDGLADAYLDRYFHTFPTRATSAGRHDLDRELERLDAADRASWLAFNRKMRQQAAAVHPRTLDEAIDRTLLRREIDREIYHLTVLRTPERFGHAVMLEPRRISLPGTFQLRWPGV